jgi:hypothetical protein
VINEAGLGGEKIAAELRALLTGEAAEGVAGQLDSLDATVANVRRAMARFRLMSGVLGRDVEMESVPSAVPHLTEADLPALPSAYREGEFDDLVAIATRETELAPHLEAAHQERVSRIAAHLVAVVRQAAASGFADEQLSREALREARHCFALWQRCLTERRRDLGW